MKRPPLITLLFSPLLAALFFTAPAAAAQLTLSWTDNSNNEDGFRIERRISGGSFAQIAVVAANVTSFIDSGVTAGTTYCYRVRAYNQAGASAYTAEACRAPASASLPTVTIGASTPTATEGGTAGRFTVSRTGSTAGALTANYTVGGTAIAGSDYAALPGSVVIPAGASSATIAVTPTNDTGVESNETVVVTLKANTAYTVGSPSSATVTIVSNDTAPPSLPTVTISASIPTATEGGTAGRFTVSRTGSTAGALTANYTVGGTAIAGSDYAALPGSVVIPAGASSATIAVTPTNDTGVESNETVVVTLKANTAYTVGSPSSATVTIVSNDHVTVDNGQTGTSFTGTWSVSSGPNPYGSTSLAAAGSGQDTYRWTPTIATTRVYEVYAWWTSLPSRSPAVEYRIRHAGGTAVVTRDQRTAGGQWVYLGTFQFNAGTAGYVQVSDVNGAGVSADAIRWVAGAMSPAPSQIPPGGIVIDNGQSGTSFTGQWSWSKGSNPYLARSLYGSGSGQDTYRWRPTIPSARLYDVYVWWTTYPNRSTNVQYRIVSAQGTVVTTRDQRTGGGRWQYLGTFQFNSGTGGYVQVSDINGPTVCADAVLFVPR
jgi:Calx-beta domain